MFAENFGAQETGKIVNDSRYRHRKRVAVAGHGVWRHNLYMAAAVYRNCRGIERELVYRPYCGDDWINPYVGSDMVHNGGA